MKKAMVFGLVMAGVVLMSGMASAQDYWETTYERTTVTTYDPYYPVVQTRTYYVNGPTYVVRPPTYVRRSYVSYGPSYTSRTYVNYGPSYSTVRVRSYSTVGW